MLNGKVRITARGGLWEIRAPLPKNATYFLLTKVALKHSIILNELEIKMQLQTGDVTSTSRYKRQIDSLLKGLVYIND